MYTLEEKLKIIDAAHSFDDLKNSAILPEPCGEDGYYFISYSHRDFKQVIPDILAFQKAGIKIWYDRGLETGISWFKDVSRKIDSFRCKGIIIYSSENFCKSASCAREIAQVIESKKSILMVKLENRAPYGLTPNATIDYASPIVEKLRSLHMLPLPALYEFTVTRMKWNGACAALTKINDRNVTRIEVPKFTKIGKKKYRVRVILQNAFSACHNLREVVIPDGWSFIYSGAFLNCPSLRRIVLGHPSKCRFGLLFGHYGFIQQLDRCSALSSIEFPTKKYHNEYIYLEEAIRNCIDLNKIDLKDVGICGDNCFRNCSSLETATIGPSDSMSGYFAFYDCSSLKSVTFTAAWREKSLPAGMFMRCSSLEKITFPKGVEIIQGHCFGYCTSLKEINLPTSIKTINGAAFKMAENLKTVVVNSKITFPLNEKFCSIDEVFPYAETFYIRKGLAYDFVNEFEQIPCECPDHSAFRRIK